MLKMSSSIKIWAALIVALILCVCIIHPGFGLGLIILMLYATLILIDHVA